LYDFGNCWDGKRFSRKDEQECSYYEAFAGTGIAVLWGFDKLR